MKKIDKLPKHRGVKLSSTLAGQKELQGMRNLIFVDCEGHGPAPTLNDDLLFEFGTVDYTTRQSFHGQGGTKETFEKFNEWLNKLGKSRKIFVSDNPAYDWQFINYYFHKFLGDNPFGHSARRISDFYAGLKGDFSDSQHWKNLRITEHDHNPVHDALGNVEAFERLLRIFTNKDKPSLNKTLSLFVKEKENIYEKGYQDATKRYSYTRELVEQEIKNELIKKVEKMKKGETGWDLSFIAHDKTLDKVIRLLKSKV